jgi:acetyl esterase/lipase
MKSTARLLALLFTSLLGAATLFAADEPPVLPLWPNGAPGSEARKDEPEQAKDYWVRNIHNPSLTVFLPPKEKATGAAILVIPGGGHRELVFNAEGVEPARFFTNLGVAAFALKYRLARETNSPYTLPLTPQQDAKRAMRLIRSHAAEWGIDPKRLGAIGFSAGGEVVSLIAYDSGGGDPAAADPIDRLNSRPDFQMMVYPGPLGIPEVVPTNAPPAFLLVANDDRGASGNIVRLLEKYRDAHVPVEAHIFARGGHAFNMGTRSKLATIKGWPQRLADWLADGGFLNPPK